MSVPKINSLSVSEINEALRRTLRGAEYLVAKNKAELTGFSKIVYGPPGPSGQRGETGAQGPEPEEGTDLALIFNNGLV